MIKKPAKSGQVPVKPIGVSSTVVKKPPVRKIGPGAGGRVYPVKFFAVA